MSDDKLGEIRKMNCGDYAKIIKYNKYKDITVEFQDDYHANVHTTYHNFINRQVKNPYHPSIHGVGMIGKKYKISINRIETKEYTTWCDMLKRCFDKHYKEKHYTYMDTTCCNEWLLYDNFYEWLHNQDNFDKWLNGERWAIDKDIIKKGNNIYNEDTCCLVPDRVNKLFTKSNSIRGSLPIGVKRNGDKFQSRCSNPFTKQYEYLGTYFTINDAFYAYKKYKEEIIKQVAETEFNAGNITKECYNAMMKYTVDIND